MSKRTWDWTNRSQTLASRIQTIFRSNAKSFLPRFFGGSERGVCESECEFYVLFSFNNSHKMTSVCVDFSLHHPFGPKSTFCTYEGVRVCGTKVPITRIKSLSTFSEIYIFWVWAEKLGRLCLGLEYDWWEPKSRRHSMALIFNIMRCSFDCPRRWEYQMWN